MEGRRWEDMETDCLVNIFERLGLDDMTLGLPFVCKSWSIASKSPLCWRVLNFRDLNFMPWSNFTKRFTVQYTPSRFSFTGFMRFVIGQGLGSAVELRFPSLFQVSWEELDYAANKCPSLKVLLWPRPMSQGKECIPGFIRKLKDLERLEMDLKPSWFPELARQISCNCLRFHTLRMSGAITEEDTLAIVNYFPKLRYLDLSNSYLPREQLMWILDGCKEVERFSVRNCFGFEADAKILQRASGIKTFEHDGCKLRDESGVCHNPKPPKRQFEALDKVGPPIFRRCPSTPMIASST